jgi:hypothetical protein
VKYVLTAISQSRKHYDGILPQYLCQNSKELTDIRGKWQNRIDTRYLTHEDGERVKRRKEVSSREWTLLPVTSSVADTTPRERLSNIFGVIPEETIRRNQWLK